ncbi:MAG TPA: hypothetical protein VJB57_04095 [Dehalococcoidia bacterium]|nr:hypothetical protein [Dehalococcoidia bacterium]
MNAAAMVLERRRVPSRSRPGAFYEMQRTPAGWEHADEGCPWWLNRNGSNQFKPCAHVIDLEQETNMTSKAIEGAPETAVATYGAAEVVKAGESFPVLHEMIDEFDAQLIVQGVDEAIVENWCYGFKQGGEVVMGLSIVGVSAAAREMAKHGEVIRADPPVIVFESDDEIRLVCTAHRFFVREGVEVEVDSATRSLRQLKYQMVNEWLDGERTGRKLRTDDPKWFEKAYSKAVRNASLPLIRDDCRSAILEAWKQTPKAEDVAAATSRREPSRGTQRQARGRPMREQTGGRPAAAPKREPIVEPSMEQLARIEEWRGVVREKHGPKAETAVNTWAARQWPDAVQDRKLRYPRLSPAAADALITRLRQALASPDGDAEKHEHDPAFPPEGADWPVCKACGVELRDDDGSQGQVESPAVPGDASEGGNPAVPAPGLTSEGQAPLLDGAGTSG